MKWIFTLLVLSGFAAAQEQSCPVETKIETAFNYSIVKPIYDFVQTNVSGKDIEATRYDLDVESVMGDKSDAYRTQTLDKDLKAGKQSRVKTIVNGIPPKAKVTARLVDVKFKDGSVWHSDGKDKCASPQITIPRH